MTITYETVALSFWIVYFGISALAMARPRPHVVPPPPAAEAPLLAVLLPVRGISESSQRFVRLLMAQDYPNFRVLLLVESEQDPATALMQVPGMERRASLVIAGEATIGSQKVHNLLAGLERLTPDDRVVVFCDADSILPANWLTQLTQPLRSGKAEVATTFRMLIPKRRQLSLCLYAYADVTVALAPRPPRTLYCWGGSTAILADRLPRLDLPRRWRGVYSDDLAFSEAVKAERLKGVLLTDLLLPSDLDHSPREIKAFGKRQFFILTLHMPLTAFGAALVPLLPLVFWTSATVRAINGSTYALYVMGIVFVLDALRAWRRWDGVRRIAGPEAAKRFRCAALAGWSLALVFGPPAFISALGAYFRREVVWAGIRYRVRGKRDVRVIERAPPGERLPD